MDSPTETRNGVERDYLPDPLGSTSALLDSSGITDTFEYWPYGEVRSHTGSSQTPFQYVGTLGYYTDLAGTRLYVRARYLQPSYARWLTVDPLWPDESAYGYAKQNVVVLIDESGEGKTAECNCISRPPRAVNVPCPKCTAFGWPIAGVPVGGSPYSITRQACYDSACSVYCAGKKRGDDLYDHLCDTPLDAFVTNQILPPCTESNPFSAECDHWCDTTGLYGEGCSASNIPPHAYGGSFCMQECSKRVCCVKAASDQNKTSILQGMFGRCKKRYKS